MATNIYNIYQSFYQRLPAGEREGSSDVDRTHITGSSADTTAPKVALHVPDRMWIDLGKSLVDNENMCRYLKSNWLATWEPTRILRNEADVDSASSPQLMNPVDLALAASHDTMIRALNQCHFASARPDRVWYAGSPTSRVPFAVIDYKRVGTVDFEEFSNYLAAGAQAQQTGNFRPALLPQQKAAKLSMIATNYAVSFKTPYVAIFDWDYLLLFVLEQAEKFDGGDWCRLTVVHDPLHMRLALLGFLEAAFQAVVKNNPQFPRYKLPQSSEKRRLPSERIAKNPKQYYGSRPGDDDGNDQYTYSGQLGSIREVSSTSKYGREASSSRYAKEKASYASARDDFGMGRLTLDPSRRGETPRSKDQKIADYCRDLESRHEASRREASRPTNPATSSSHGYDPREYDPRYRR
jgi:hypothetical protein